MADTYTEAEHVALVADAVARENAALTEAKAALETKVSELTAAKDVLEAEKAQLETKVAEAETALEDHKAEVARAAEVAKLKTERVEAIKAAATLPDTYFTAEREQAWAEMDEATFAHVVDGIKASAGTTAGTAGRETSAFREGQEAGQGLNHDESPAPARAMFAAKRAGQN